MRLASIMWHLPTEREFSLLQLPSVETDGLTLLNDESLEMNVVISRKKSYAIQLIQETEMNEKTGN